MSKKWKSLDAIASRVAEQVNGGVTTNISRVKMTVVRDQVHKARAHRLKEIGRQKLFKIPRQYYQKIKCVPVVCTPIICDGEDTGAKELRAVIPSLIGELGRRSLRYIGTMDRKTEFDYRNTNGEDFSEYFPLIQAVNNPYAILENNNTLILYNPPTPNLEFICVELITDNPEHEIIANDCEEYGDYPIPGDELLVIEDYAFKECMKIKVNAFDLQQDTAPVATNQN